MSQRDREATDRRAAATSTVYPAYNAPTEKQRAYFLRLISSPLFTDEERRLSLEWLARHGTKHRIADQIRWLKDQRQERTGR